MTLVLVVLRFLEWQNSRFLVDSEVASDVIPDAARILSPNPVAISVLRLLFLPIRDTEASHQECHEPLRTAKTRSRESLG